MSRKIDVGRTVEGTFEIYRDQAGVLLAAAALVIVVDAAVTNLLVELRPRLFFVAFAVSLSINVFYAGMVVSLVSDVQDGRRDQSVGELFRSVGPVLLPLIAVVLILIVALTFGFLLLIVPGLFLMTIWAVVAPVTVVERPGVIRAFGRSRELVRGNGWQVFGVILLLILIGILVRLILGGIGVALGDAGRIVLGYVASVVVAPLLALGVSVLYFQLRGLRGEGVSPEPAGELRGEPSAPAPTRPAGGRPAGDQPLRSPERPAGPESPRPPGQ